MDESSAAPEAITARIEKLLSDAGMTQRALAAEAGLSTTQMSRLMNHDRKLTAGELASIANALGTTASALLGQAEADRPLAVAQRLGRTSHTADLDGPFQRAQDLLKLRDLLDQLFQRPDEDEVVAVSVPRSGFYKGEGIELAARVRAALDLGDGPIEDLEGLAARFGLDAATGPMPAHLHGLLVAAQPRRAVVETGPGTGKTATAVALLNAGDTLGRRRFTLAHELGHLLFADPELYVADYAGEKKPGQAGLIEHRADCFAGHLLAPDAAVAAVVAEVNERLGKPSAGLPNADLSAEEERDTNDQVAVWTAAVVGCLATRHGLSVGASEVRAEDAGHISAEQRLLIAGWSATQIIETCGKQDEWGVLATVNGVVPPHVLLGQALHAYQSGMLGPRPLGTLYDTDQIDGLTSELHAAGWAPEHVTV